jgi:hypothetical protein
MNKKIIAAMACLAFLFPLNSMSESFKMPPFPEDELRTYRSYYKDGDVNPDDLARSQRMLYLEDPSLLKWHLFWVGEGASRRPQVSLTEERNNGTTANHTFYFKSGDSFIIEGFDRVVKDQSGKVVQRKKRDLTHAMWEYPDDVCLIYTINYALRGLDLASPGVEHSFNLWNGGLTPMKATVKGAETITLRDGSEYKCFRVEIRPDPTEMLGPVLGRAINVFLGQYTLWFDVNGSHPMVQYMGPMGKVNSGSAPTAVYELASDKPRPGE